MIKDLLEILAFTNEVELTRLNLAPPEGSGIVMNAEVIIVYPGGDNPVTDLVIETLGRMAQEGYSISREVIARTAGNLFQYTCQKDLSKRWIIDLEECQDGVYR